MAATKNISHACLIATGLAKTAAAIHAPRQKHRSEMRRVFVMEDAEEESCKRLQKMRICTKRLDGMGIILMNLITWTMIGIR